MLIGNRNSFAIGIEPLNPSWERRYRPELAAWAQLSIWADGENICLNLLNGEKSVRDGVNVPLAPIADWLVRSWTFLEFEERPGRFPLHDSSVATVQMWGDVRAHADVDEDDWLDARERWWSRHFLRAGADGAHLPNLSMVRGDERLFLEWTPAASVCSAAPKFLSPGGCHVIPWAEGKDVLAHFVSRVAGWLRDSGVGDVYAWACRDDPVNEAAPDFSEALQAYTGVAASTLLERTNSCDEADLREKLGLTADGTDPGGSVTTQVLRNLPLGVSGAVLDQALNLDCETRRSTGFAEELRGLAHDAARAAPDPETSGYLVAQELRKHLDMGGRPVGRVEEQLADLGVALMDSGLDCNRERMLAGSRQGCGAAAVINRTPRTRTRWGKRFEAVRALGHLLMDPYREGTVGAASTPFAQPWARRRAGTFAAELLLPKEALQEDAHSLDSYAEERNFERLLERYGVGARTAAYHLWNRGFLSSSQVRDDLIDQFSGKQYS